MFLTHLDCLSLAHWLHNTVSEEGLGPVCFAMVDNAGELIWFERMDLAPAHTISLAIAKAYTAARLGTTTADFHSQLQKNQLQLSDYLDSQLTSVPGGTPLYDNDHRLVGAIGVSGSNSQHDQVLASSAAMYFQTL